MNDLIRRTDAIDAVANYLYILCLAFHYCMTEDESRECATSILEPVPSTPQSNTHNTLEALEQRWIPCSERLPETNGDYLVTFRYLIFYPVEVCEFKNGKWDSGMYDVVAWMPLPKPYREDGDADV